MYNQKVNHNLKSNTMYGINLNKKETRTEVRQYEFKYLIENGYTQETYKGLDIFSSDISSCFLLKVFEGSAANHKAYINYRTKERRDKAIQEYKDSHDRRKEYKEKCKKENKKSEHAGAAQAIRDELKNNFAGVKFSVTSESFSMGNAVRISWADGPTSKAVESITSKYQYGHFDGMTDMYEYTNTRDDLPQAKYVTNSRHMGEELKTICLPILNEYGFNENFGNDSADQILYRIWAKTDIPVNGKVTGIEKSDITCAFTEDFYRLVIELLGGTKSQPINKIEKPTAQNIPVGTVQIIEYSDKAIAVIGDTKSIKDKLKELGGSFNPRLTCGVGWIFSKSKFEMVVNALTPQQSEVIQIDKTQDSEEVEEVETIEGLNIQPVLGNMQDNRRHKEFEDIHPLNICDPESTQYKVVLKEYNNECKTIQKYEISKSQ